MGKSERTKAEQPDRASLERQRFWLNYLKMGQTDQAWFDQHVPSLLKIATQDYGPAQPWQTGPAITPIVVPAPARRRGQSVSKKLLADALDRLGGSYKQVEPVAVAS